MYQWIIVIIFVFCLGIAAILDIFNQRQGRK